MMLETKESLLQDSYQQGRDAAAYLKLFYDRDSDYMNVIEAAMGFQKLIVAKKLVPPYGSIFDVLSARTPCLEDIFSIYGNNVTEVKLLLKSFNTSLTGAIIKSMMELDPLIDTLDVDKVLKFSLTLKEIHLPTCSDVYPEICSLPALYDMLKIRAQLEEKFAHVQLLMEGRFQNLSSLTTVFNREIDQQPHLYKHIKQEDREHLKDILDYYVKHMNICLTDISRLYEEILNSGQPTMKTADDYEKFLNNLKLAKWVISETCKQAGPGVKVLYNVTNHQELSAKIVKLITSSEASTMNSIRFTNAMIDFVEDINEKFVHNGYDERLLNQSLYDVEMMDDLLNRYLNQSTAEVFMKSEFYKLLHLANVPFQQGVHVSELALF